MTKININHVFHVFLSYLRKDDVFSSHPYGPMDTSSTSGAPTEKDGVWTVPWRSLHLTYGTGFQLSIYPNTPVGRIYIESIGK